MADDDDDVGFGNCECVFRPPAPRAAANEFRLSLRPSPPPPRPMPLSHSSITSVLPLSRRANPLVAARHIVNPHYDFTRI